MKTDETTLIASLEHYGRDYVHSVVMEECAELIQAVSKMFRYEKTDEGYSDGLAVIRSNLIEEMADVRICLDYLEIMHGISETTVDKVQEEKEARILRRIHGGK